MLILNIAAKSIDEKHLKYLKLYVFWVESWMRDILIVFLNAIRVPKGPLKMLLLELNRFIFISNFWRIVIFSVHAGGHKIKLYIVSGSRKSNINVASTRLSQKIVEELDFCGMVQTCTWNLDLHETSTDINPHLQPESITFKKWKVGIRCDL